MRLNMQEKSKAKSASSKAEKRQKFKELAENRTKNALKAIRVIAKLGNKNAYEFDANDVSKIVKALTKEVDALKARMSSSNGKEAVEFTLD
jgi:deoxyxylulose-5-phosphate synthase